MLSIKVLDKVVKLVGVFTVEKKEFECMVSTESNVSLSVLQLRTFILKSPMRIIFFFSNESFSNNADVKSSMNSRIETFACLYTQSTIVFF